jgi:hypothetical protein
MPKQFTKAALRIIEFLGGDPKSGKCMCPCHPDGSKPSLSIGSGDRQPVLVRCFGRNDRQHDLEIIDYLRTKGVWPTADGLSGDAATPAAEQRRSPDERRDYACRIWRDLERTSGRDLADDLLDYMAARGLDRVPDTAMMTMPRTMWGRGSVERERLRDDDYGMVLPVRDKTGKLQGIQVTWLDYVAEVPDGVSKDDLSKDELLKLDWRLAAKRQREPQRQTYGLLSGNFIELMPLDYKKPLRVLIIGEGTETALAASQLTGYPAIAGGGKGFMSSVNPPIANQYILLVDDDDSGGSRDEAGKLAARLVGALGTKLITCTVRLAMPTRPEGGKSGYDWDDALIDAGKNKAKLLKLAAAIKEAPTFEQTEEEKQEANREATLDRLAALKAQGDLAAYEDQRRAAAAKLK